eukprot:6698911-Prymnesium_polylepis.1
MVADPTGAEVRAGAVGCRSGVMVAADETARAAAVTVEAGMAGVAMVQVAMVVEVTEEKMVEATAMEATVA